MEADARTLLTFVGPLAIMYMTYSSISGTAVAAKSANLKPVSIGQIGVGPKLPSADVELRNPFVPKSGSGGGEPLAEGAKESDPEKSKEPLRLDGTAIVGAIRFAILNGVRVPEGDYFRGMRLTKVEATQVTLTGESEQVVLPLEISRSDGANAPAATIISGSRPSARESIAKGLKALTEDRNDAPARAGTGTAARPATGSASRTANSATVKREPGRASGMPGGSLLIVPGGAAKTSGTARGGTGR